MSYLEKVQDFCANCHKRNKPDLCVTIDGKKFCCADCPDNNPQSKKKPAICEFC